MAPAQAAAVPPSITRTAEPEAIPLLPEIEVTATRRARPLFETPRAASVATHREVVERQPATAADAIAEEPGVHIQATNAGAGSPFIRGLTGQQVLVLVDGVRLNNATFRAGPNQYMATIDPFSVERIEIVRGPSSVLYGSDAIGGVVNVVTRGRDDLEESRAERTDPDVALIGRYGTAAKEKTVRAEGGASYSGFGVTTGVTYGDFDDLEGGRRTGAQPNTSYQQRAVDLKLEALPLEDPDHRVTLAYQHLEQLNMARTDAVSSGRNLRFDFDPQERHLAYLGYDSEAGSARVSYHRQLEERKIVTPSSPAVLQRTRDVTSSWGFLALARAPEVARMRFTPGVEAYFEHVSSRRVDHDRATGTFTPRRGTFANGADYRTVAVFLQDEIDLDPLTVVLGTRYTHVEHDGHFQDPLTGPVSIDGSSDGIVGSAHVMYAPLEALRLHAGVAQGFRAPNVEDLTIFGPSGPGFQLPNPDLDPETSITYDVGAKLDLRDEGRAWLPRVEGSVAAYYTELDDLIVRRPSSVTITGVTGPVLTRENAGKADVRGFELGTRIWITREWSVFGSFHWTYGRNRTDDEPLSKIPPAQGTAGVRWEPVPGRYFVEAYGHFARDQERLSAADATDPRIPRGGTPGYETYNLRGGARLGDHVEVLAEVENLLDRDYRVHGSGVNGPGAAATFTLKIGF